MTQVRSIKSGRLQAAQTFQERVWALCARIPRGQVVTYGDIAQRLGSQAYRAVGAALHRNPYAPDVPCHRVVGADGSLTGFAGGLAKKRRMLQAEGITMRQGRVDLQRHRYRLR